MARRGTSLRGALMYAKWACVSRTYKPHLADPVYLAELWNNYDDLRAVMHPIEPGALRLVGVGYR